MSSSPNKNNNKNQNKIIKDEADNEDRPKKYEGQEIVHDDMIYFWQCQAPGQTGDMKGCGFFRILDMKAEGRGPCIIDSL